MCKNHKQLLTKKKMNKSKKVHKTVFKFSFKKKENKQNFSKQEQKTPSPSDVARISVIKASWFRTKSMENPVPYTSNIFDSNRNQTG